MRITQDIRDYAREHGLGEEQVIQVGMKEKAQEFVASGSEIYQKA
jgi:phosphomethylpyrimidine synthase